MKHNTKSSVLILLSSLILTLSCNKTKEDNLVYIFPEQEMTASDFIDQSRYVQLETTDACILSTIDAIRQYKDMIAILSDRKIFLFTSQGKFLTKIDRLGNGSEEYNTINDFQIYDDNVYVLSGIQNKLLEYTLEGRVRGSASSMSVLRFPAMSRYPATLSPCESSSTVRVVSGSDSRASS